MKQSITYEKIRITVDYPIPIRKGKCSGCGKTVPKDLKVTQMHHTVYKYEIATVKKNPLLALDNALEFGFCCHPIADGFRELLLSNPRGGFRSIEKMINVALLLPKDQQAHLAAFCRTFLDFFDKKRVK